MLMTEDAAEVLEQARRDPQDVDSVLGAVDDLADEVDWDVERMLNGDEG
jgi:hypothetical protein